MGGWAAVEREMVEAGWAVEGCRHTIPPPQLDRRSDRRTSASYPPSPRNQRAPHSMRPTQHNNQLQTVSAGRPRCSVCKITWQKLGKP